MRRILHVFQEASTIWIMYFGKVIRMELKKKMLAGFQLQNSRWRLYHIFLRFISERLWIAKHDIIRKNHYKFRVSKIKNVRARFFVHLKHICVHDICVLNIPCTLKWRLSTRVRHGHISVYLLLYSGFITLEINLRTYWRKVTLLFTLKTRKG